ncbi:MAG: prephenate dehydrogenase [bacterium]
MINRLCIVGVGLIGGSLALALRRAGYVGTVVGVGRSQSNLNDAVNLGVIDKAYQDLEQGVAGADMVVLAVPVGATQRVCEVLKEALSPTAILTDAGSVKGEVIRQVEAAFGELPACFVPGHPIAGTENSGAAAAFDSLYSGRRVLLTPTSVSSPKAVAAVKGMWEMAGAEVECMDPGQHDKVLALTSHLPHMLAFGLVDSLARQEESQRIFRYAAGGFRDFTRIAGSDPAMWRDICLTNKEALLEAMDVYQADLATLRSAIEEGDAEALQAIFTRAREARYQFSQQVNS